MTSVDGAHAGDSPHRRGRAAVARACRLRSTAVIVSAFILVSACRFQRIWTGLEIQQDGTIKLAAEEPMCGCLSVVNVSQEDLRLSAAQNDAVVGETTLKAGERQRYRFDWGGISIEDYYVVTVTSLDGQPRDADDVMEIEDRPRWTECETASCEFGQLRMHTVGREQ